MTVSIEKGNSHFSFLIFNVFLICYFDLICINEKKEIMKNVERVKEGEWNEWKE